MLMMYCTFIGADLGQSDVESFWTSVEELRPLKTRPPTTGTTWDAPLTELGTRAKWCNSAPNHFGQRVQHKPLSSLVG